MKKLTIIFIALMLTSCAYERVVVSGHNQDGEPFTETVRYYGGCNDTIFYDWRGEQVRHSTKRWKVVTDGPFTKN